VGRPSSSAARLRQRRPVRTSEPARPRPQHAPDSRLAILAVDLFAGCAQMSAGVASTLQDRLVQRERRHHRSAETPKLPSQFLRWWKVASEIPSFRQTSSIGVPASARHNAITICSAVNLLVLTGRPPCPFPGGTGGAERYLNTRGSVDQEAG
jgi:hypothetical protein